MDDKEEVKDADDAGSKVDEEGDDASKKEPEEKKKREAIDKQQAFVEFKESQEGMVLQERI
jgi:hypothetical protein